MIRIGMGDEQIKGERGDAFHYRSNVQTGSPRVNHESTLDASQNEETYAFILNSPCVFKELPGLLVPGGGACMAARRTAVIFPFSTGSDLNFRTEIRV